MCVRVGLRSFHIEIYENHLWTMIFWLNSTYDTTLHFDRLLSYFHAAAAVASLYFINIYFLLFNLIYPRLHRNSTIELLMMMKMIKTYSQIDVNSRAIYKYTEASMKLTYNREKKEEKKTNQFENISLVFCSVHFSCS